MKFDINNNPALMQEAGNTPKAQFIKLVYLNTPTPSTRTDLQVQSANGFVVKTIQNGVQTVEQYPNTDLVELILNYDPGTPIVLIGDFVKFDSYYFTARDLVLFRTANCESLTYFYLNYYDEKVFDFSVFPNMQTLGMVGWYELTDLYIPQESFGVLDIFGVPKLEKIEIKSQSVKVKVFTGTTSLREIKLRATNSDNYNSIVELLDSTSITTGVLILQTGDSQNTQAAQAATAKGWTVEYVDA